MSYHIYTTEGIVLKRGVFGEANTILYVLTRDLGLIIASAQGTRLNGSKLKGSLQEYSFVSISCVKGKNGWKITNVSDSYNYFFNYPKYRLVLAKISLLILKMVAGENIHPEIFEITKSGFNYLGKISKEDLSELETLMVLRILYELGYVAKHADLLIYLDKVSIFDSDVLQNVRKDKKKIVNIINHALKQSQL